MALRNRVSFGEEEFIKNTNDYYKNSEEEEELSIDAVFDEENCSPAYKRYKKLDFLRNVRDQWLSTDETLPYVYKLWVWKTLGKDDGAEPVDGNDFEINNVAGLTISQAILLELYFEENKR